MKASPKLFFNCPATISCVFSIATFIYPSRQDSVPACGRVSSSVPLGAAGNEAYALTFIVDAATDADFDLLSNDVLEELCRRTGCLGCELRCWFVHGGRERDFTGQGRQKFR